MLFEIVIVICAALAGAGITLLSFRLIGRKAPKTIVYAAAGVAMMAYTQWERYTWADRYAVSLPADTRVITKLPYDGWLEPWARVLLRNDKLVLLDGAATLTNDNYPHIRLVETLLIERNHDTITLRQFVDCRQMRRIPVMGDVPLTEAGLPPSESWITGGEPRALFEAVCQGG